MLKCIYLTLMMMALLMLVWCGNNEDIIGSRTDTVEELEITSPFLFADGVSTAYLIATVIDSSGKPAVNVPVYFQTTAGSIAKQVRTEVDGKAYSFITSAASVSDLEVTVTATVLDSTFSLPKSNFGTQQLSLTVQGFKQFRDRQIDLKKCTSLGDNTASIKILFIGIAFTAELDATSLPADGISKAKVKVILKESTSKKAISGGVVSLAAAYGTVINKITTNDQGIAETDLTAYSAAIADTLSLEYGNLFIYKIPIRYEAPTLSLTPEQAYLIADGTSQENFVITVKSQKNTPIIGAEIKFSSSAGTISPSNAQTNSQGQAEASLISATQVVTNVRVIASLNLFADTALVSFIEPILELSPTVGELSADGTSQLSFAASLLLPNNTPVVGAEINFMTSAGTISPAKGWTNSEGKLQAVLKSGFSANPNVVVTASFQNLIKTASIKFLSPILTLTPSEAKLLANGVSKQNFTATLTSQANVPIPNAAIQFYATKGTILNSLVTTNSEGKAQTELRSGSAADSNILVIAKFHDCADTALVEFVESSFQTGLQLSGETILYRDGYSSTPITATVIDDNNNPVPNATIFFSCLHGTIQANSITDASGQAVVIYTPDVAENSTVDEISATIGSTVAKHAIQLLGLTMTIYANPDSIPADGNSESQITVQLKLTESQMAVPGITILFSSNKGFIATNASTNQQGVASIALRTAAQPGIATVTARYGGFVKTTQVQFYLNSPQSLLLSADPNYIWVKETGNLEQTLITATVLGVQGQPIGHEVAVKFFLQNGPGGGAGFVLAGGNPTAESEPITTVSGKASIGFLAGTRAGTVEIRAELVGQSGTAAQTTNLTIRSGPPYIWIDPTNPNNVVSHMTLTLDYFNLAGWTSLTDYNVGLLIGDKYNNPVELGTTAYFTTTGGVITTDVKTDARGMGNVVLASGQPRPYVCPQDPNFNPHSIENPNNPGLYLPIILPDFELNEVINSCNNTGENDGIAVITAYTHGRDQAGNEAKVWATTQVIFSGPILRYDVFVNPPVDTLHLGQTANIYIRVYDINGNPPAAGSSLKAKTSAGKISAEDLMPDKEHYGYGSTFYSTTLLNNLDPTEDEPVMAEVSVELVAPFGKIAKAVYVFLAIP